MKSPKNATSPDPAGRGAGSSGRGGPGRGYGGSYGYGYGGINGAGGAEDAWFDEGTPMTGCCWLLGGTSLVSFVSEGDFFPRSGLKMAFFGVGFVRFVFFFRAAVTHKGILTIRQPDSIP